tara:strand:- start:873 stop:2093 length:1221 start_codon:yes stop_codon:yes gene_type:complete
MNKIILSVLLSVTSSICLSQTLDSPLIEKLKRDVIYLSSDELEGRNTGTESEKIAADYIVEKLKLYEVKPKGTNGFFQEFKAKINANPHTNTDAKEITGQNVVGYFDNQAENTVIIGAHYDHIGYGEYGSRYFGEPDVHNGADDNASGVSVMIQLADQLKSIKDYNFLFIAFSGEEYGLYGSSYYAKNPTINLNNVSYMLNFDMIGRYVDSVGLAVNGVGTSSSWVDLLAKANENFDFELVTSESGVGPSDHTSFYFQNIPVLHFFTGQHDDYHTPRDDFDKINFEGMQKILFFVKNLIKNSTEIEKFDFNETANQSKDVPKFKVTLGVMPDYMYSGKGLRIDGVSNGKVADSYGILKGDIVTKIGDVDVFDIMSYMQGLSNYNDGEKAVLEIQRDKKTIKIEVVF